MHRLLESLLTVLEDFLLDHFLLEDLIVELERLLVDEIIIQTFAVSWLNDVTLRVHTVLVTLLSRYLVLAFKLFFLFNGVVVM